MHCESTKVPKYQSKSTQILWHFGTLALCLSIAFTLRTTILSLYFRYLTTYERDYLKCPDQFVCIILGHK